jgi:hypothetical protein
LDTHTNADTYLHTNSDVYPYTLSYRYSHCYGYTFPYKPPHQSTSRPGQQRQMD